jgi:hypothetical protein
MDNGFNVSLLKWESFPTKYNAFSERWKMMKKSISALVFILFYLGLFAQQADCQVLKGPYLGQKAPEKTPEIFAPGFISTGFNTQRLTFSPDGNECFFSLMVGFEIILWTRFHNGGWTEPEVAPFSGQYYEGYPSFHPDGSKVYFHSYRPENGGTTPSDKVHIWVVERTKNGWGEPRMLGPAVNGKGSVSGPSVTRDGTLYFAQYQENGKEYAMRSELIGGVYQTPEPLPPKIRHAMHFSISPDERYLIIPRGKDETLPGGGSSYYVTFRNEEGEWSDLIDLGDQIRLMRPGSAYISSISADGEYFFFQGIPKWTLIKSHNGRLNYSDLKNKLVNEPTYDRGTIYWVKASFIEELRPNKRP